MTGEYMEPDGEFHLVTRADGTVGIVPSLASIEGTELFIPMPPGWTADPSMTYEYAPSGTMQHHTEMIFAYEELRKENERLKTQLESTQASYGTCAAKLDKAQERIDAMLAQANAMREFARKFVLWESDEDEIDERFDAFCKAGKAAQP